MPMLKDHTRGFGSPNRYFQGRGLINNLVKYTSEYGKRVYAIIDVFFYSDFSKKFGEMYTAADSHILCELFGGEVCEKEISRVTENARQFEPDVVVGIGGGKTLDTAKCTAANLNLPVIIVPTTASTDAPCSALAVIYKETGEHSHIRFFDSNPNLVLVDSEIVAKAPVRFLVAGMGDALSTYYEARANQESDSPNIVSGGYRRTKLGLAVAELCRDILYKQGLKAKLAAEAGICTEAVEDIIEANTLLSGVGVENCGSAGAHSIADGLTALPEGKKSLHGEKCSFGIICQLVFENRPVEDLEEVIKFCLSVGLPVTLEDLGIEANGKNIKTIAEASMHSIIWNNEPVSVNIEEVENCIAAANKIACYYKEQFLSAPKAVASTP